MKLRIVFTLLTAFVLVSATQVLAQDAGDAAQPIQNLGQLGKVQAKAYLQSAQGAVDLQRERNPGAQTRTSGQTLAGIAKVILFLGWNWLVLYFGEPRHLSR